MVGPDLGLSEAEFKALVHQLSSSLDYLGCIWRGAEGILFSIALCFIIPSQCQSFMFLRRRHFRRPVSYLPQRFGVNKFINWCVCFSWGAIFHSNTNILEHSPPDMTFFGLLYCARALATQYGDGEALLEFWKESLYWYNRLGKVRNDQHLRTFFWNITCSGSTE